MFGLFGKPSKDKFVQLVLAEFRRAGIAIEFRYDAADFSLRYEPGGRYSLGNSYDDYCQADTAHRKRLLGSIVATMQTLNQDVAFADSLDQLVAVIRERALMAFTELEYRISGRKEFPVLAARPVTDWFATAVVIDHPQSMSYVTEKHLEESGIPFEEAYGIGYQRLADCTVPKFAQDPAGFFTSQWRDDYDASRILLTGLFDDLPIDGDPVLVLPNRLTLMVTGSHQPDSIRAMLKAAEEIVQTKPRPHNPAPLTIRDGCITDFTVAPGSPIFHEVQRAAKLAAVFYYQQQKELLERLHTATQKDLFVAKFTLMELKTGGYQSQSVWSRNVPTLLPRADVIAFYDPEKPENERLLGFAPWDRVLSIAGDLMLDTGDFPSRYYVSKFPTPEQLQQLLA